MLKHTIQGIAIAAVALFISVQGAFASPWPEYQKLLLNERFGFGASMFTGVNTYGGAGGAEVWVTNANDSGAGSLREALTGDTSRWIRFDPAFGHYNIYLASRINVGGWKTIDARGAVDVKLFNHGLDIRSQHVIVENVIFQQGTDDGLKILDGADNIWIDHCSFGSWSDEALSVIQPGASYTEVTVSWCKATNINHVMLIGHTTGDPYGSNMRVTLHHNWLGDNFSRQPRIRRAWVHAFNNYLVNWGDYGMASVDSGQLRTEYNIFDAGSDEDAVIYSISGEPNGFVNCGYDFEIDSAVCRENLQNNVFWPPNYYGYTLDTNYFALRAAIIANAGATR